LELQELDYLEQIRNFWMLSHELHFINSYFYNLNLELYLSDESLLIYERFFFHSMREIEDMPWLETVVSRRGDVLWIYEPDYSIRAIRTMDNNILIVSVPKNEIMHILDFASTYMPINIYIVDQDERVLFASGDEFILSEEDSDFFIRNPMTANGWKIITTASMDYFDAEIRQAQTLFFAAILLLMVLFLVVIYIIMRDIIARESEKKQHELQALQARIKPHFIYNALDAINWMALDNGNEQISDALVNLATLLRKNFTLGDDIVTIRDEMEHAALYVEAMKYRSDCAITLNFDVEEVMLDKQAIKFTFQPIIENAILHGFMKESRSSGSILIKGRIEEGRNVILIQDNGAGFIQQEDSGFGLKSVAERLRLYSGEESKMTIESTVGSGTSVQLKWS